MNLHCQRCLYRDSRRDFFAGDIDRPGNGRRNLFKYSTGNALQFPPTTPIIWDNLELDLNPATTRDHHSGLDFHHRMRVSCPWRTESVPAMIAAVLVTLLIGTSPAHAGILAPQQIGYDIKDLERSLGSTQSGSSSAPDSKQSSADSERDKKIDPLGLLTATLPGNQSSSSSSSSSSGGAGSGVVSAHMSGTVFMPDDSPLGRLPEDHGLSQPDPPGTDLLRPPRG
jgi:hypothetical protein